MSPSRLLQSPSRISSGPPTNGSGNFAPPTRIRKRQDAWLNKTIVILKGQWKGYIGIVKEATDTTVRIELHTNCKKITVNRDWIKLKDEVNPISEEFQTTKNSWDPSRTPMREDITATPMRMPGTPLRTPLRVPGTPVHGTAWDPSMPNTPMRTSTPSWDPDYSSSSSWNSSPSFTSYSPAPSHYDGTPENPITPATPGTYTPIDSQRSPLDSTPHSYIPTTPTTPGPTTPRLVENQEFFNSEKLQSFVPEIEVKVTSEKWKNYEGVILEIYPSSCKVLLDKDSKGESTKETISISKDLLERVVPVKKDKVIIVGGEMSGEKGDLIGIDGADGIVKMTSNGDIKILNLHLLAKYRTLSS